MVWTSKIQCQSSDKSVPIDAVTGEERGKTMTPKAAIIFESSGFEASCRVRNGAKRYINMLPTMKPLEQ